MGGGEGEVAVLQERSFQPLIRMSKAWAARQRKKRNSLRPKLCGFAPLTHQPILTQYSQCAAEGQEMVVMACWEGLSTVKTNSSLTVTLSM